MKKELEKTYLDILDIIDYKVKWYAGQLQAENLPEELRSEYEKRIEFLSNLSKYLF